MEYIVFAWVISTIIGLYIMAKKETISVKAYRIGLIWASSLAVLLAAAKAVKNSSYAALIIIIALWAIYSLYLLRKSANESSLQID